MQLRNYCKFALVITMVASCAPQRPYRAPIHRSFFNDTPSDYVREILGPAALRSAGLFNPLAVSQLVAKIESDRLVSETDEMALVGIISSQLIQHQFVSGFRCATALGDGDDVKVVDQKQQPMPAC